jgi:hypothetical protein
MNLNAIVGPYVSAVNPWVVVSIQQSTGYTTSQDGRQVPSYAAPVAIQAQVQALQYNDMMQLDGINIEGERRAIYLNGNWDGVERPDGRGGDLITFPDGSIWLVVLVLENWGSTDGWVKVAVTRQMNQ